MRGSIRLAIKQSIEDASDGAGADSDDEDNQQQHPPKRRRGRPKRAGGAHHDVDNDNVDASTKTKTKSKPTTKTTTTPSTKKKRKMSGLPRGARRIPSPPGHKPIFRNGRRTCNIVQCIQYSLPEGYCAKHGGIAPPKKNCSFSNCVRKSIRGGVCLKHGATKKKCKFEGCDSGIANNGVCRTHGAIIDKCLVEGCVNRKIQGGVCKRHGAITKKYFCKRDQCTRTALKGGVCWTHGANNKINRKRCSYGGGSCPNLSIKCGFCIRHGRSELGLSRVRKKKKGEDKGGACATAWTTEEAWVMKKKKKSSRGGKKKKKKRRGRANKTEGAGGEEDDDALSVLKSESESEDSNSDSSSDDSSSSNQKEMSKKTSLAKAILKKRAKERPSKLLGARVRMIGGDYEADVGKEGVIVETTYGWYRLDEGSGVGGFVRAKNFEVLEYTAQEIEVEVEEMEEPNDDDEPHANESEDVGSNNNDESNEDEEEEEEGESQSEMESETDEVANEHWMRPRKKAARNTPPELVKSRNMGRPLVGPADRKLLHAKVRVTGGLSEGREGTIISSYYGWFTLRVKNDSNGEAARPGGETLLNIRRGQLEVLEYAEEGEGEGDDDDGVGAAVDDVAMESRLVPEAVKSCDDNDEFASMNSMLGRGRSRKIPDRFEPGPETKQQQPGKTMTMMMIKPESVPSDSYYSSSMAMLESESKRQTKKRDRTRPRKEILAMKGVTVGVEQSAITSKKWPSAYCNREKCFKFKQVGCGGFCRAHKVGYVEPRPYHLCAFEGCDKWRQTGFGGFCKTHKHRKRADKSVKGHLVQPLSFCGRDGCFKYKLLDCGGFCRAHKDGVAGAKSDTFCAFEGCVAKWKKTGFGGFCKAHMEGSPKFKTPESEMSESEEESDRPLPKKQRRGKHQKTVVIAKATKNNDHDDGDDGNSIQEKSTGKKTKGPDHPSNRCKYNECVKWKQTGTGGYCLAHKSMAPGFKIEEQRPVPERKGPRPWERCKYTGCDKWMQSGLAGYCYSHKKYSKVVRPSYSCDYCKYEGCTKWRRGKFGGYCHSHKNMRNATKDNDNGDCSDSDDDDNHPIYKNQGSISGPNKRCKFKGCMKWRQGNLGAYCNAHTDMSTSGPPLDQRCKYKGCAKWRQGNLGGYCHAHHNMRNATKDNDNDEGSESDDDDNHAIYKNQGSASKPTKVTCCKYEGCTKWRQGTLGGYCHSHKNMRSATKNMRNDCSESDDDDNHPIYKNQGSTSRPTREVLNWIRTLSASQQQENIAKGHRVKVRFEDNVWYGGVISCVMSRGENNRLINHGSRIKISFDDGTEEVGEFPDSDIIVDDVQNGNHHVDASAFVPLKEEPQSPLINDLSDDVGDDVIDGNALADKEHDEDSHDNACLDECCIESEYDMTDHFGFICQPCETDDEASGYDDDDDDDDDVVMPSNNDGNFGVNGNDEREDDVYYSSDETISPADDNDCLDKKVQVKEENPSSNNVPSVNAGAKRDDAVLTNDNNDGVKEKGSLATVENSSLANVADSSNAFSPPSATKTIDHNSQKMRNNDLCDDKCNSDNLMAKMNRSEKERVSTTDKDAPQANVASGMVPYTASSPSLERTANPPSQNAKNDDSSNGKKSNIDDSDDYDSEEEEEMGAFIYRSSLTAKSIAEQGNAGSGRVGDRHIPENPTTMTSSNGEAQ